MTYAARLAKLEAFASAECWPTYSGNIATNNPLQKGARAGKRMTFGPHHRFGVEPYHTRFEDIAWALYDAQGERATMKRAELICVCDDQQEAFRVAAGILIAEQEREAKRA